MSQAERSLSLLYGISALVTFYRTVAFFNGTFALRGTIIIMQ